ncbi:dihydrofolate reductase family protein [uncultured Bacteroides sp.]|uniref:dihydrofolate reductase family protein n=1 Tax=uncultured Bacteroides sp. TaxID=162156 RepID=UPI0025AFAD54|nr:dihydrofolate reductase family protein [uncultured Bacteroides sp.]
MVTKLSPDQWPYTGATTYVLTHHSEVDAIENVRFKNMDACQLVEELKQEAGGNIWICGGAEVVRQLIEKNMNYNKKIEYG